MIGGHGLRLSKPQSRNPTRSFHHSAPDDRGRGRGRFPDRSPTGLSLAALPSVAAMHASKEVNYVRQAQRLKSADTTRAPECRHRQSPVRLRPGQYVGTARDFKRCHRT